MKINFGGARIKKQFKKVGVFWFRHYGFFFVLFFILVNAFAAYLLYQNVYLSGWSEEEKMAYINSKQSMVKLRKDRFDGAVKNIQKRHEFSRKEFVPIENIFDVSQQ